MEILAWVEKPTDVLFILSKKMETAPTMTLLGPGGIVITPADPPSDTVFYSLTNVGGDFPYQEVYSLRDAPAGQWTVVLDNLPEPGTYGVTMVGAKPGPRLTGITAANLTPERVSIGWSLAAAAPVTLTLHANPGPTTTTVVITDTVPATTKTLGDFTGYLLRTDPTPITDGSAQSFEANFSGLPGGTYHIWAMAEDGQNPPVRVYAEAPVTIAHAWNETWQANLHATPAFRQLDLSWDKHANPDVDSYRLNVSPPPYTETLAITVTNRITYTLESLSPGATYRLSLRCRGHRPGTCPHVTLRADLGHDDHRRLQPAARLACADHRRGGSGDRIAPGDFRSTAVPRDGQPVPGITAAGLRDGVRATGDHANDRRGAGFGCHHHQPDPGRGQLHPAHPGDRRGHNAHP